MRQCLAITNLAVVKICEINVLSEAEKELIPRSKIARAGSGNRVVLLISDITENILFQKLVSDLQDQKVWRSVPG